MQRKLGSEIAGRGSSRGGIIHFITIQIEIPIESSQVTDWNLNLNCNTTKLSLTLSLGGCARAIRSSKDRLLQN